METILTMLTIAIFIADVILALIMVTLKQQADLLEGLRKVIYELNDARFEILGLIHKSSRVLSDKEVEIMNKEMRLPF